MKAIFQILIFAILCSSCFLPNGSQSNPKVWEDNKEDLQKIVNRVLLNPEKFEEGENLIPEDLDFSYDKTFDIRGNLKDKNDLKITFYTDRGLVDHYSAIIYTTQKGLVKQFDENVKNGGNDFKLQNNWYAIND